MCKERIEDTIVILKLWLMRNEGKFYPKAVEEAKHLIEHFEAMAAMLKIGHEET